MALRGHSSIQGSTDIPTLYNLLPGYLPMPKAMHDITLQKYLQQNESPSGWWGEFHKCFISFMKAWFGKAATKENDWCYEYLPTLTGDHSHMNTVVDMADGTVKGYFVMGENPSVGSMNGALERKALRKLDWLVVRDFSLIETAEFWRTAPEISRGEVRTEDIGTEVFFFPAAAHTEKSGSFTNTQRLLQWHPKGQSHHRRQRVKVERWRLCVCMTFPNRVSDDATWRAQATNALTAIRRANISNRMRTRWRASHLL